MSAPIHEVPLPNAISMLAIKPNQATATHDLVVAVDPRVGLYAFILTSTHILFGILLCNDQFLFNHCNAGVLDRRAV